MEPPLTDFTTVGELGARLDSALTTRTSTDGNDPTFLVRELYSEKKMDIRVLVRDVVRTYILKKTKLI